MSALAGLVALFLPLLSTLGYELSLLTALVASLGAGHLAALSPGRARDSESPFPGATRPVLVMFLRGLPASLALLAPPLVFTLLRGLRVPQCNMAEGLAFYDAAAEKGLEGVIAKLRRSQYEPGKRISRDW